MTDEQLAVQAVSEAQHILEEYLKPRPRNDERSILDKLVEVLERPELLVAGSIGCSERAWAERVQTSCRAAPVHLECRLRPRPAVPITTTINLP
jgi:hypothetical protein